MLYISHPTRFCQRVSGEHASDFSTCKHTVRHHKHMKCMEHHIKSMYWLYSTCKCLKIAILCNFIDFYIFPENRHDIFDTSFRIDLQNLFGQCGAQLAQTESIAVQIHILNVPAESLEAATHRHLDTLHVFQNLKTGIFQKKETFQMLLDIHFFFFSISAWKVSQRYRKWSENTSLGVCFLKF